MPCGFDHERSFQSVFFKLFWRIGGIGAQFECSCELTWIRVSSDNLALNPDTPLFVLSRHLTLEITVHHVPCAQLNLLRTFFWLVRDEEVLQV